MRTSRVFILVFFACSLGGVAWAADWTEWTYLETQQGIKIEVKTKDHGPGGTDIRFRCTNQVYNKLSVELEDKVYSCRDGSTDSGSDEECGSGSHDPGEVASTTADTAKCEGHGGVGKVTVKLAVSRVGE